MEGLVEKLLRLEGAKHKALVEINVSAYDASVRKQMRLLAVPRKNAFDEAGDVERLLALSQLITLNARLLQSLVSTTAWSDRAGHIAKRGNASVAGPRRESVEAR
jgi:hypothetical protein